jgi:hypothetical protein
MKLTRALLAVAAGVTVGLTFSYGAHAAEIAQVSQTRPNQAMLTSGAFALGVPYVASIIVAAESNHPGDKNLYVPVAGPWMDLSDRHCATGEICGHEGLYKGLLIADGIFQGIGALNIAGAFLFPETLTVTEAAKRNRHLTAGVRVAPVSVGSGYGLAAVGAF